MTVHLVGAGPGDPGLMTVRAVSLLSTADVVVHDRLVDARVVALARRDAEIIDVGKRPGATAWTQPSINDLLVERGRAVSSVVRLKGGDPYVFGRGGEEAAALEAAGVAYDVVPGISSVTAAPVAAGVPLTMRGVSSAFTVVTGHDVTDTASAVEWESVARANTTVVVVMGGSSRREVAERLIAAGRAAETPVIAIESATLPNQRSIRTNLRDLGALEFGSPSVIVVGEVAGLEFASYEHRPLAGLHVVVTREVAPHDPLESLLSDAGASTVAFPTIAVVDPADGGAALEKAAGSAAQYDWIIFSSKNAVERFFGALRDVRGVGGARIAAIGSATAEALRLRGVIADLVPMRFVDEALLEAFVTPEAPGRVLLPRAAGARAVLPDGLRALGWTVDVVETYRTVHPAPNRAAIEALDGADVVTFCSSSAVDGFIEVAGPDRMAPIVVSIGPVTSATLRARGIVVDLEAEEHTVEGIVAALVAYRRSE